MKIFTLNKQQASNWEKIREKGKYKYSLRWALMIGICFTAVLFILDQFILEVPLDILQIIIHFVITFVGGFILGIVNWMTLEYGYKLFKEKAVPHDLKDENISS